MLKIDASLDQTGQILRTGLSLATLTGCIVQTEKIPGGISASHMAFIKTLGKICNAEMSGVKEGSDKFVFKPHSVSAAEYRFDFTEYEGVSVNLILQTILFPLSFGDKRSYLYLTGRMDVPHTPSYEYFRDFYIPAITSMGVKCNCKLMAVDKQGVGQMLVSITPSEELRPFVLPPDKPVDKFLADQLILPVSLARGSSSFTTEEVTQNLLSNISLVEKFLDVRFHISGGLGNPAFIEKLGEAF
ncbi:MAG: hypothetical protein J6U98_00215 [Abditibacteriota bacterium]|nr:hypothetical protein [Abditibacteriota bacterium]MBP5092977.1 hypothetical protein [Abditibacteriota bacterium]MBP5738309.1 hypothetical protein [Abditibacteriota bacterium]